MAIPSATIAAFAPWGNAQLAFEVGGTTTSVDPSTGNVVQNAETIEYLASLTIQYPGWNAAPGADTTVYSCQGRLLSPALLDARITNGSQADAVINGHRGRFELTFDLSQRAVHRRDLRTLINGTFRVVGGGST